MREIERDGWMAGKRQREIERERGSGDLVSSLVLLIKALVDVLYIFSGAQGWKIHLTNFIMRERADGSPHPPLA